MAKGTKKAKAGQAKDRHERRFIPRPTSSPVVVNVLGGVAAAALGAGTWAQFGHGWTDSPLPPYGFAPLLIAVGAVAFGAAVWLGTSGEVPVRVGAGGIAVDKGKEVTRIAWYDVERVVWDPDRQLLSVQGKDETGRAQQLALTPKVHPEAVAWIVKEARDRIPEQVDVPEEALGLPEAHPGDGERLVMDAVQVVGKRCAASDRIIAYEPDARVCPRCERVYYKDSVPETCACRASLAGLRATEGVA
jgi:hypothetical protein